ncbi:AbrB/MazE/SpoVT family DNA-binding domain-containing protein [Paenibacillus sp. FSL P4-0288]|uniref:AbrB/MazE/SpoVT family DNA-binding domain-containing protein n=1 Tax=Paenibacillus sp. FSL P4-0288 TaxID=2921633 RepID=UPI0030F93642
MIIYPISKDCITTLPKETRDFLNIPAEGKVISVETAGKYQIRIYEPMPNRMSFLRKVTKKGQLRIPSLLSKNWNIAEGGAVYYTIQEPYIVITLAGPEIKCPLCLEKGMLYGKTCPICEGTGKTRKSLLGPYGDVADLSHKSRKYEISINIINQVSGPPSVTVYGKQSSQSDYEQSIQNYLTQLLALEDYDIN